MKRFFDTELKKTSYYKLYIDQDIPARIPEMKQAKGNVPEGIIGIEVHSIAGQQLIYQYFNDKYFFKALRISSDSNDPKLALKVATALKDLRQTQGDVRIPFFISGYGNHTAPLVYIREGDEEGILYADSLGNVVKQSMEINAATKIPVYTVNDAYQIDRKSCHTNTAVILRQAAGKNPSEEFIVPNLLASLKQRATLRKTETGECYISPLPNGLLITSQTRRFIDKNKELENDPPVHKNKTLDEQREQYNMATPSRSLEEEFADIDLLNTEDPQKIEEEMNKEKKGVMNLYLYKKGIKLADIMETQFYLEQMHEQLQENHEPVMTATQNQDFILKAKAELKLQGPITHYISTNPLTMSRPGLHQFAEDYLASVLQTNSKGPT